MTSGGHMHIVVAFDGSDGASAALREAYRIASRTDPQAADTLDLLWVLDPRVDAAAVQAEHTTDAMQIVEARAHDTMRQAIAQLQGSTQGAALPAVLHSIVAHVAPHEDVAACLKRIAGERGAELIAVASRRAAGLKGLATGSLAQELLRISTLPVLVVRA